MSLPYLLSLQVQEELEALLAIFGDEISISLDGHSIELKLDTNRSVKFVLPDDYPASTPTAELAGFPRGFSSKLESGVYAEICERTINSPALFDLISFFREEAAALVNNLVAEKESKTPSSLQSLSSSLDKDTSDVLDIVIFHGKQVTDRKSVFVSHVARVSNATDISQAMRQLLQDSRISRATHNIYAYRYRDIKGSLHADNDDDGEESAGSRLAELLNLMKVENVLVVVTRWFGGVLLGPSRFRTILNCAREAIEAQDWIVKR